MVLSETQLETWSHQGSVGLSSSTYESIKNALNVAVNLATGKTFEVYVQGSYKNDTNIRGDSDVDIIVQLNSTFQYDYLSMSEAEKTRFDLAYKTNATYLWHNFRADVLASLRNHYGTLSVTEGNKSIKIAGNSSRLPADVVVCLQYRKYQNFESIDNQKYTEGMVFYTMNGNLRVISFPKQHYENGLRKNKQTNGWYKPAVRMFKNIRGILVDRKTIGENLVPSYFLECLLYNVPDNEFRTSFQTTFCNVANWLSDANLNSMVTQCKLSNLFGVLNDRWSEGSAKQFIQSLIALWNG